MTIDEAKAIIAKTNSPYLKRDMQKFIQRQQKKGKNKKSKANALHIIGGFFNSKGGRVCHAKKKITSSTLHRIKAEMKPLKMVEKEA